MRAYVFKRTALLLLACIGTAFGESSLPSGYGTSKELCIQGSCITNTSYWRGGAGGEYGDMSGSKKQTTSPFIGVKYRGVSGYNGKELMQTSVGLRYLSVERNSARLGGYDTRGNKSNGVDGSVSIGLNIRPNSPRTPLFINALYSVEYIYDTSLLHFMGAELEGFLIATPKLRYEYALGYSRYIAGGYRLSQVPSVRLEGSSDMIHINLTLAYALTARTHCYVKAYGKIRNLAQSNSFEYNGADTRISAQKQYFAGLELGLGF